MPPRPAFRKLGGVRVRVLPAHAASQQTFGRRPPLLDGPLRAAAA
jgi:hypothetical protein